MGKNGQKKVMIGPDSRAQRASSAGWKAQTIPSAEAELRGEHNDKSKNTGNEEATVWQDLRSQSASSLGRTAQNTEGESRNENEKR